MSAPSKYFVIDDLIVYCRQTWLQKHIGGGGACAVSVSPGFKYSVVQLNL